MPPNPAERTETGDGDRIGIVAGGEAEIVGGRVDLLRQRDLRLVNRVRDIAVSAASLGSNELQELLLGADYLVVRISRRIPAKDRCVIILAAHEKANAMDIAHEAEFAKREAPCGPLAF